MNETSRVYILVDEENRVTRIEGEYTLPSDLTGWIKVDEGEPCDRLNLAQSHYLDKPLMTDDGVWQYKYDGTIIERTEAEMDADRTPTPVIPSIEERINDMENAICELYESLG